MRIELGLEVLCDDRPKRCPEGSLHRGQRAAKACREQARYMLIMMVMMMMVIW